MINLHEYFHITPPAAERGRRRRCLLSLSSYLLTRAMESNTALSIVLRSNWVTTNTSCAIVPLRAMSLKPCSVGTVTCPATDRLFSSVALLWDRGQSANRQYAPLPVVLHRVWSSLSLSCPAPRSSPLRPGSGGLTDAPAPARSYCGSTPDAPAESSLRPPPRPRPPQMVVPRDTRRPSPLRERPAEALPTGINPCPITCDPAAPPRAAQHTTPSAQSHPSLSLYSHLRHAPPRIEPTPHPPCLSFTSSAVAHRTRTRPSSSSHRRHGLEQRHGR